ncbi:uncharacterized protein B0H64DRAFT_61527 [Chaetomium fimeti]|uniref:Uncharacterized protein n=1 Tax=Chaetomium fimeti TaxID=1854472 RepID=A0AAE0H5A8_9PEZI|nr:hypothetical protein B0H64DRAFT_61527 [Chaetomium fimeti]
MPAGYLDIVETLRRLSVVWRMAVRGILRFVNSDGASTKRGSSLRVKVVNVCPEAGFHFPLWSVPLTPSEKERDKDVSAACGPHRLLKIQGPCHPALFDFLLGVLPTAFAGWDANDSVTPRTDCRGTGPASPGHSSYIRNLRNRSAWERVSTRTVLESSRLVPRVPARLPPRFEAPPTVSAKRTRCRPVGLVPGENFRMFEIHCRQVQHEETFDVSGIRGCSRRSCGELLADTAQLSWNSAGQFGSSPGKALAGGRRWGGFQTEIPSPIRTHSIEIFFPRTLSPHLHLTTWNPGGAGAVEGRKQPWPGTTKQELRKVHLISGFAPGSHWLLE